MTSDISPCRLLTIKSQGETNTPLNVFSSSKANSDCVTTTAPLSPSRPARNRSKWVNLRAQPGVTEIGTFLGMKEHKVSFKSLLGGPVVV